MNKTKLNIISKSLPTGAKKIQNPIWDSSKELYAVYFEGKLLPTIKKIDSQKEFERYLHLFKTDVFYSYSWYEV